MNSKKKQRERKKNSNFLFVFSTKKICYNSIYLFLCYIVIFLFDCPPQNPNFENVGMFSRLYCLLYWWRCVKRWDEKRCKEEVDKIKVSVSHGPLSCSYTHPTPLFSPLLHSLLHDFILNFIDYVLSDWHCFYIINIWYAKKRKDER